MGEEYRVQVAEITVKMGEENSLPPISWIKRSNLVNGDVILVWDYAGNGRSKQFSALVLTCLRYHRLPKYLSYSSIAMILKPYDFVVAVFDKLLYI